MLYVRSKENFLKSMNQALMAALLFFNADICLFEAGHGRSIHFSQVLSKPFDRRKTSIFRLFVEVLYPT